MSRLTQIHKKIRTNFNAYLSDKRKIELLAENIELFEEIPVSYLNEFFKRAPVFAFAENNEVLLTTAHSYIHYSFENKENMSLDELIVLLNKANACFQRIINSYQLLLPTLLSTEHSDHILIANFGLHKIKFLRAEMRLFFIEKEATNEIQNITIKRKELTNIIDEYTLFHSILDNQYKDPFLRERLSINSKLLFSIQEGLGQARNLLNVLPQRKSQKRYLPGTISENKFSTQVGIDSSKVKRKKQEVKKNNKSSSLSLNQSQQMHSESGNSYEGNDLAILSAAAVEMAPMGITHDESEMIFPSMFDPDVVPQFLWSQPPVPKSVEDSKKFLIEFKKWAHVYFNTKSDFPEIEKTGKCLEKIAHSLLYAAVTLQKESSVFKGEKCNPVVQKAIQLLLYTSEKGAQSTLEAVEKLKNLSMTYAALLKPFIRSFLHLESEKYISHLRMQLASGNYSNISFLGLEAQEIVERLFKLFETELTDEDYDKVMKCCLDCVIRAHDRLTEQNHVLFNQGY
ncbi:hypothetical protein [Legionella tucsonensis]|uniref:Uncharacterized protein n=1 Tax=Legionella tucsonensis TaxID=40335 RepID=A0A0W0ZX03_9GAMM|nr:hypothetical protein [Legionella tucsonensis]KTD73588.1 hypothetical protein Ltuc_1435 [Legionella tucsonensis]